METGTGRKGKGGDKVTVKSDGYLVREFGKPAHSVLIRTTDPERQNLADQAAEAARRNGDIVAYFDDADKAIKVMEYENDVHAALIDTLLAALPFVEDAESNPVYKKAHVRKRIAEIRAVLKKAGAI